jgi:hypothetical protein
MRNPLLDSVQIGPIQVTRHGAGIRTRIISPGGPVRALECLARRLLFPTTLAPLTGPPMCNECRALASACVSASVSRSVGAQSQERLLELCPEFSLLGEELQLTNTPGGLLSVVRHVCPAFQTAILARR